MEAKQFARYNTGMAIKTTVVGSYPIPFWLRGDTSRTTLRDAILVVLKTQELAGIDVVADGELNRFDPGHPETNGMIDYFVSQMEGIRTRFSLTDIEAFRADAGLTYRTDPAGIVTGPVSDYEFTRKLTGLPMKFTCTGPHMLTKVLTDRHYRSRPELAMAIADVLRKQLSSIDAEVVQLDEANISGHPEDAEWAQAALNHVLDGIAGVRALHGAPCDVARASVVAAIAAERGPTPVDDVEPVYVRDAYVVK